ncbi:MAG: hypothetical protein A2167_05725 [Planctomycetes bacterium RBG_13_46_10]|nr:MAG: hypothetical protein A2167_05725 [Planctomycetes bacterium RBG_13_46_10]
MKKTTKVIYIVFSVIVIAAIIITAAVALFADRALKMAVESAGSKALNVKVKVDSADLSIFAGKAGLKNLAIDNPPGYEQQKLLELQDTKVVIQTSSLLSDTVRIKEIKLDGATLAVEQKGLSSNLQDLIKGMPQQEEPSGKKLLIDTLEITNITANVKMLPIPGKTDIVTLKIPAIKMTNLGSDKKIDLAALTGQIIMEIARGIIEQGLDILPKDMINAMNSTLGGALNLSKDIFGEGKDKGEKVLKGTEDIGKGITDGLKDLLKKDKK